MSSSWVHRFGNPPICCGESVVGDHSSTGRVEDKIEGHSRKNDSENRPSESFPAKAHKYLRLQFAKDVEDSEFKFKRNSEELRIQSYDRAAKQL